MAALLGAGVTLAASGALQYLSAREQRKEARGAAARAERTGEELQQLIAETTPQARAELQGGFDEAQGFLGDVGSLLLSGQQDLEQQFAQEREVGSAALQRLSDVILGGDFSQLQLDPGFEFRREQGEEAIARRAAAAGSFGGGGNLKDFARFNQGLASQEFQAAIGRLAGLQQVGSQANRTFATLNQGLLGQRAQLGLTQAQLAQNEGSALAQLTQTSAANQANVRSNQAANVNAFNLQAANAQAAGTQAFANSLQNLALLAAFSGQFGGGGGTGSANLTGHPQTVTPQTGLPTPAPAFAPGSFATPGGIPPPTLPTGTPTVGFGFA